MEKNWIEVEKRIREIIRISQELTDMTGRPFTPDGHMVGSIGEAHAAFAYGVELHRPGYPTHDGNVVVLGKSREVQVKLTRRSDVAIKGFYDLLLVFRLNENGEFEEVYNGDGRRPWQLLIEKGRKPAKNGEINITLNALRQLNSSTSTDDRIEKLR
jgi:hypothetical protein